MGVFKDDYCELVLYFLNIKMLDFYNININRNAKIIFYLSDC